MRRTRLTDMPSVIMWGTLVCIWFGACLCIEPFRNIAPGLFLHISRGPSIVTGAMMVVVGMAGVAFPRTFALIATVTMGALRSFQAAYTANWFPFGLWLGAIVIAVWYSTRPSHRERAIDARSS